MITPGPTELIIILFVVLLLFGAKKLPDLAKGLGEGIREFKSATKGHKEQDKIDGVKKEEKDWLDAILPERYILSKYTTNNKLSVSL